MPEFPKSGRLKHKATHPPATLGVFFWEIALHRTRPMRSGPRRLSPGRRNFAEFRKLELNRPFLILPLSSGWYFFGRSLYPAGRRRKPFSSANLAIPRVCGAISFRVPPGQGAINNYLYMCIVERIDRRRCWRRDQGSGRAWPAIGPALISLLTGAAFGLMLAERPG
jgi:hypothetical protein